MVSTPVPGLLRGLQQPQDIRTHILPQYKRIIDLVHRHDRPFLLHSCGAIFDVMEDLIDGCGVETNVLCLDDERSVKEYVTALRRDSADKGGVAIGSGNQISEYIPVQNFIVMTEAVREFRSKG